ncbi:MAG: DUF5703 domain-containing protein [Verrucomicrobia bacterium]|nr:DUF5703 domain-containing protein [Verrucomicrobiota bacterium]
MNDSHPIHTTLLALACAILPVVASAQSLLNGSFETNGANLTNDFSDNVGLYELDTVGGTIPGWTFNTPGAGTGRWFMQNGCGFGLASDGTAFLNLSNALAGYTASCTITGLIVGQSYTITFDASRRQNVTAGSFTVALDLTPPVTTTINAADLPANPGLANYAPQAISFTATSTSHTLTLDSANASGNGFLVDHFAIIPAAPPGALDHFAIAPIASPQTLGTAITGITITAQDAANKTVTGFSGTVAFGGTAGVTGTSPGFTSGVLNGVSVTPMVGGSNLTVTVDDGAGHTGSATIASILAPMPPGTLADYNLTWTSPSSSSLGSMPLGNGETGLNVWVEGDGDLLFYIARSDSESEANDNLKMGRIRVKLTPNPFTSGQPFQQTLDLPNGQILINAGPGGAQTRLRVWVDANHPVIHVQGDSDQALAIETSYELPFRPPALVTSPSATAANRGDVLLDEYANQIVWWHRNTVSSFASRLESEGLGSLYPTLRDPILNLTFGGLIRGTGLIRAGQQKLASSTPTRAIDIAVDVLSNQTPAVTTWVDAIRALAQTHAALDNAQAFAAHQAWWSAFWNRSHLDIGGPAETRVISERYAYQRFINACSLRGKYPTNYNGSIFTMDVPAGAPTWGGFTGSAVNADYRDWGSLRIMWQNTRHLFWPLLASGDTDLMKPVMDLCQEATPLCLARCQAWNGHSGLLMTEAAGFGGVSVFGAGIPQHLKYHRGGMTDMSVMMADYFDHTGDTAFFAETYLPFADGVVTFFENHYPGRDNDGKMVMGPAGAVETYQTVVNPAVEVSALRRILQNLLRVEPALVGTQRRARYQDLLDILPPVPTRTVLGQELIAVYQSGDAGRELVELPQIYTVWPYRQASLGQSSLLAAARRDLGTRSLSFDGTPDGQYNETGGWLYTPTVAAALNLPLEAKRLVVRNLTEEAPSTSAGGFRNPPMPADHPSKPRFPAFWETRMDYIPDQCHGGASIHGLESMLIQSEGNKIYLFPAWPEEWNISFKVHAPGNTILEGEFRNGAVQALTVTPSSRLADVIDMSTAANRIRTLVGVVCADQNHLFGLPQMLDGQPAIPAAAISSVTGPWLAQYGASLSGGLAGPFAAAEWGGSVAKGNAIFVHVLNWPGETLTLPALALGRQITGSDALTGGTAGIVQNASGIRITLPAANRDAIDTIIRLDLDGSAEALAWHQPYVGSLATAAAASATNELLGHEAAKAADADRTTSWRSGAATATLTIPFGGTRSIGRTDIQFDNGTRPTAQNIAVTLEYRNPAGAWASVWSGTAYSQVWSRAFTPVEATAIRLTTNAQGVRQLDVFSAPSATPDYIRTDDAATGGTQIEVPAGDVLFRESLAGSTILVKTGAGTLSLIDPAAHGGATRLLGGTLRLLPPITSPVPGFVRHFDASTLALANAASVNQWNDLSPNKSHAAPQTGHAPTFVANAVHGLGAVHFTAGTSATDSQSLNFTRASNLRSVFSVFKGSSFLLTDTAAYDFHRPNDTDPAAPLWAPAALNWTNGNILAGRTYLNGNSIDGAATPMPTAANNGFNLTTVITAGGVQADGFNRDRAYHAGDQTQAEVILYQSALAATQRLRNERYLQVKWLGQAPVGNILPPATALSLNATEAVFDLNGATQTVASLAGVTGSAVTLNGGNLVIAGNTGDAVFQGAITGAGSLTNNGTLRLAGDAILAIGSVLTNVGLLDIMTWNGTLPAGFINHGIVLDRSNVRITSCAVTGGDFSLTITAYPGHNYQLQRTDTLRGPWVDTGAAQPGGGSALTFSDPGGGKLPSRFYRIAVTP